MKEFQFPLKSIRQDIDKLTNEQRVLCDFDDWMYVDANWMIPEKHYSSRRMLLFTAMNAIKCPEYRSISHHTGSSQNQNQNPIFIFASGYSRNKTTKNLKKLHCKINLIFVSHGKQSENQSYII